MSVKVQNFNEKVYKKASLGIDVCADIEDTLTEVLQAAYNNELCPVYIDGDAKKEALEKIATLAAYVVGLQSNDEV